MHSFRRLALLLALGLPASHAVLAQSSSSTPSTQDQGQTQQPALTQPQMSVQERIRIRREQRRAAAIHDAYAHTYESYATMGYMRFTPGPSPRQRVAMYAWNSGLTRYYNQRLGVTLDGRGYYGTAYVGISSGTSVTRPSISVYTMMLGPTYRFYVQPKYSLSGRAMGGLAHGNFSGDTNGFGAKTLGLYPDGYTFAANGGLVGEYNLTPRVSLRLSGEDLLTGFGSSAQNSFGFTLGFVYRFGKQ